MLRGVAPRALTAAIALTAGAASLAAMTVVVATRICAFAESLVVVPVESAAPPPAAPARCPVGDDVHVAVYSVFVDAMRASPPMTRSQILALVSADAEYAALDHKPEVASAVETELSHLATDLCASEPACAAIGIYAASGLGVALTDASMLPFAIDDDLLWERLIASEYVELPYDQSHRLVAHRVRDDERLVGVAACLIRL